MATADGPVGKAVDKLLKRAEALLAAGDADAALAIMSQLDAAGGGGEDGAAPASTAAAAPSASRPPLQKARTMAAIGGPKANGSGKSGVPRGGTLVKLKGIDGLKALDYEKYKGRMGRVIEMVGRQYLNNDGVTELATILLDARPADRANGDNCNGVWVQVPLDNIEIQ